jgi:hypothetical protein
VLLGIRVDTSRFNYPPIVGTIKNTGKKFTKLEPPPKKKKKKPGRKLFKKKIKVGVLVGWVGGGGGGLEIIS